MSNNTTGNPLVESIPSTRGGVSALASADAPFIYFDNAPVIAFANCIMRITLEAFRDMYGPDGEVVNDRVVVAHLRMNIEAAKSLRAALDNALLLAMPVTTPTTPAARQPKMN